MLGVVKQQKQKKDKTMSDSPEHDPQESTVDKAEAFEPAYKPAEVEPKSVEQLRDEEVAMRTDVVNEINANNPRSLVDKSTGGNKPMTEVGLAHELALTDNTAFDAEKAATEKAETDAATEQARVEQEQETARLEKERQAKSDAEKAEMQAALEEHWKQRDELAKRLTKPSQIWIGVGQHVNNPDFLNESQIDAQLQQFDSDWETERAQQRQANAA